MESAAPGVRISLTLSKLSASAREVLRACSPVTFDLAADQAFLVVGGVGPARVECFTTPKTPREVIAFGPDCKFVQSIPLGFFPGWNRLADDNARFEEISLDIWRSVARNGGELKRFRPQPHTTKE